MTLPGGHAFLQPPGAAQWISRLSTDATRYRAAVRAGARRAPQGGEPSAIDAIPQIGGERGSRARGGGGDRDERHDTDRGRDMAAPAPRRGSSR